MQDFSDDLASCIATLSTVNYTSELHNQTTLRKVAERLPYYLQVRVKRELSKLRESEKIADMEFLAKLIREAASEANDPVFGSWVCRYVKLDKQTSDLTLQANSLDMLLLQQRHQSFQTDSQGLFKIQI